MKKYHFQLAPLFAIFGALAFFIMPTIASAALPANELWRENLVNHVVGFGKNTTGGKGGTLCQVTNLNDSGAGSLRACAEAVGPMWITFTVSGTITLQSEIYVKSNKTIDGRGQNITISNRGFMIGKWVIGNTTNSVIIHNISIKNVHGNAMVNIAEDASNIWVDHVTFQTQDDESVYVGSVGGDGYNGAPPHSVTLSWLHFILSPLPGGGDGGGPPQGGTITNKSILISDPTLPQDTAVTVTMHHNHYDNMYVRHPLARFATMHSFNNYYHKTSYSAQPMNESKYYSQNDIFEPVGSYPMVQPDPGSNPYGNTPGANVKVLNPWLINGAVVIERNASTIFNPASFYSYTAETANAALQTKIINTAGRLNTDPYGGATPPPPPSTVFSTLDPILGNSVNWTSSGGTWSVISPAGNPVYQQQSSTVDTLSSAGQAGWTNYTVEAKVNPLAIRTTNSSAFVRLMGRFQDVNNYYYVLLGQSGGVNNVLQIKKIVGGTVTQLTSTPFTVTPGTWYTVKLSMIGNTLTAYVNGALIATATDTSFSSGKIALGTVNADAQFDDVTVSTPDTTPPSVPTNLTATAISSSQINLSWNASTDNIAIAGYKLYRGGVQIATITSGTTYQNTGLPPLTSFSYTVSSYDAAGNTSAQSTGASATTQGTPPPPSTVFSTLDPLLGNSANWTPLGGTWSVITDSGNPVYQQLSTVSAAYTSAGQATWSNYTVETRVKPLAIRTANSSAFVRLMGRFQDINNYYYLLFGQSGGLNNVVQIKKVVAGVVVQLTSTPFTVTPGTWYILKLGLTGNTLSAFVNGTLVSTATDTSFTAGKVALGTVNADAQFDDVVVTLPSTAFTITSSAGTGGTIAPVGPVSVNQGSNQTFTISPNAGYALTTLTVNGANITPVTSYTFSNVQTNHTISASFSPLPTANISASPSSIGTGDSSTLTWSSTNATQCTGTNFNTAATSGNIVVTPLTTTTTYTITCTGAGGNATANASVIVNNVSPAPTLNASGLLTWTWNTTNATTCTASGGWSGTQSVNGSTNFNLPLSGATYTITCSGPGGTVTRTLTVSGDQSATVSTKFTTGQNITTTAIVNVRTTPSTGGAILGTQATGATGIVIGGPVNANGYWWWQINYATGADGWSVENWMN